MPADDSGIHTEVVDYHAGGTAMKGYLAYDPGASDSRPGVVVFPEWWGLDDYIRGRARMLAQLGYTAFAADMYGGGTTADNPTDAGNLMNAVTGDVDAVNARVRAAVDRIASQETVESSRLGAIGYCFGGAMALHAARIGLELQGVVSFHGALSSLHEPAPGEVKAKILVLHGGADALVPDEQVERFREEMDEAGADYRIEVYPGVLHAFTNPAADENGEKYGLPLAYDADADRQSWEEMKGFLGTVLG